METCKEIELTEEMIEAATEALRQFVSPQTSASQLARMAEAAMLAALSRLPKSALSR
jgi:hypothetical protein